MEFESKNYIGEAYAFIDCSASRAEIESILPKVREDTQTPKKLELLLTEGFTHIRSLNDKELSQIALDAEKAGIKYVMEAKYPGESNEETAGELRAILNNTSNLLFCKTDEQIFSKIVYKNKGNYVFVE